MQIADFVEEKVQSYSLKVKDVLLKSVLYAPNNKKETISICFATS